MLSPLVRTLNVRALKCSHKIHNKFSGTGPNTFFVGTLVVTQYSENIGMKPLFQSNKLKMIENPRIINLELLDQYTKTLKQELSMRKG